jgi:hypothetical protein
MKITISNPLVREAVYFAYKGRCFFTGRPIKRDKMVIDHLNPVSKGGIDSFSNYVLTFQDLNAGKSKKLDMDHLERMQSVVENVYAPRAAKIYERLVRIKCLKAGRKPKDLKFIRTRDLFWVEDRGIEVFSNSPLVTEDNINELLAQLEKFLEIAKRDDCDYCFDVWLTNELRKQIRSLWYHVGDKYFRLIKKTKYYDNSSPEKWAWVYFTKEFLEFLAWKEEEEIAFESVWDIEDDKEYRKRLKKLCLKYPPPLKFRDQILR